LKKKIIVICVLVIGVAGLSYLCLKDCMIYAQNDYNASILAGRQDYSVNEDVQAYGCEDEYSTPDLIAAVGENGVHGYIKYEDTLDESDYITSPNEAVKWAQKKRDLAKKNAYRAIPLYKNDGKTVIGEYRIYY